MSIITHHHMVNAKKVTQKLRSSLHFFMSSSCLASGPWAPRSFPLREASSAFMLYVLMLESVGERAKDVPGSVWHIPQGIVAKFDRHFEQILISRMFLPKS
jgi:hypothetical protein